MSAGCVACHNSRPDSPKKDWKVGDVRGVLEITRPLSHSVAHTRRSLQGTYVLFGALMIVGLAGLALVIGRLKRISAELEERVVERTAQLSTTNADLQKEVTLRVQAESDLTRRAEELSRSNAELERFSYAVSHDLQEPLRMVASFTQLLRQRYRGNLDHEADEFIDFATDGAKRMQHLLNDLLQYSRVGTRGRPFEATDFEDVLASALANLHLALEEAGAVVTHAPLPTAAGDRTQLVQLFQNLLGNALKFRSKEAPRIHVSAERRGDEYVFSIRDNGIGIDPQFHARIFQVFQRLHTAREYPGTGIGLAICKRVVERHGGRIWVESQPGKGSDFRFTIPLRGEKHAT
jgi:light-regulated signal transduction histidine kinase (bacteriophytochrome)